MAKGADSLDFILLGLLALHPSTGYNLKKVMDQSIRYITPVALSQIYPALKHLATQGLVTFQVEERTGKPNLKIYSITESGLTLFRQWLAEPYQPDPYRYDHFILRFYFSSQLDHPGLLNHTRTELAFRQSQLEAMRNRELDTPDSMDALDMERMAKFWRSYHQYGVQFLETYTHWLEHILQVVGQDH